MSMYAPLDEVLRYVTEIAETLLNTIDTFFGCPKREFMMRL